MSLVDLAADAADALIGDLDVPYALIFSPGRDIGGIIPNVTVQETLIEEDTLTVHPVESGTPVSDHVFRNPSLIEMLVGWSDSTGGFPGYILGVYQDLLALRAMREPFSVSTGKQLYDNMMFGNITVRTDPDSETILMVVARLQEVIITDTGAGSSSDGQAASSSDMGNQNTPVAPTAPTFVQNQGIFNGSSVAPIGGGGGASSGVFLSGI